MPSKKRTQKQPPFADYGKRIRQAREAAGFSQKGLAEHLGWKFDSNSRLSGYEREQREPGLSEFHAIAQACGVDPVWLIFGREEQPA